MPEESPAFGRELNDEELDGTLFPEFLSRWFNVSEVSLVDYCSPDATESYGCYCDDFDPVTGQGVIECPSYGNFCLTPFCNSTCLYINVKHTIDDDAQTLEDCYTFFEPYQQTSCFGARFAGTDPPELLISVNGETCNGDYDDASNRLLIDCKSSDVEVDVPAHDVLLDGFLYATPTYNQYCKAVDCPMVTCPSGTIDFPQAYFLDFNCSYLGEFPPIGLNEPECEYFTFGTTDVCCSKPPICDLCGGDGTVITKPDVVVAVPGQSDLSCGDLLEFANDRRISEDTCNELVQVTAGSCGCSMPVSTESPTVSPTVAATGVPVTGDSLKAIETPPPSSTWMATSQYAFWLCSLLAGSFALR